MYRSRWLMGVMLLVIGLGGCYSRTTPIRRGPIEERGFLNHKYVTRFPLLCNGLWCMQTVYIGNCELQDADGSALTEIVVKHGDRLCVVNRSSCYIVLTFATDLFGRSQPYVSLAPGECTNLSVNQGATGSYGLELICDCGDATGEGHTNPTVRIGGGDDDGDDPDG
jgi:hypothetical protein